MCRAVMGFQVVENSYMVMPTLSDTNLPDSRTGYLMSRTKSEFELYSAFVWNLAHFVPKFKNVFIHSFNWFLWHFYTYVITVKSNLT